MRQLLTNPTLNGWGSLLGLVGLAFAAYTWWESRTFPLLTAQVKPIRTIWVSSEGVDNLQISANGKRIKGPVTAAQIAIWNAGKRPIKGEDVLEPVRIRMENNTPILSARILRRTRDVTDFNIDETSKSNGVITARFRILEQGDGALVQVTYMGADKVAFHLSGAIVGQRSLEFAAPPTVDSRPVVLERSIFVTVVNVAIILVLCFLIFGHIKKTIPKFKKDIEQARTIWQIASLRNRVLGFGLLGLKTTLDWVFLPIAIGLIVYFAGLATQTYPPFSYQ